MAKTSMFSVANRITQRLEKIGELRGGLDDSLEQLQKTIPTIKSVLLDAEKKQMDNDGVREWLQKVGDSFYEADELVDEYYIETLRQSRSGNKMTKQVSNFFISTSNFPSCKMRRKLKVLMKKLANISADRDGFQLEDGHEKKLDGVNVTDAAELTSTDSSIIGQKIGRNEDYIKAITQRLLENENDDVSVQAIWGMEGSGRSELARLVFDSDSVMDHFQLRMWVELYWGDCSDLNLVLQKIINSSAPPHKQVKRNLTPNELHVRLRNEIKGKRFLLIFVDAKFDDNREDWQKLKDLLTNGVKGNNIVLTTCSPQTASFMSDGEVFRMYVLNSQDSWVLFTKVAFKRGQEPVNEKIIEIGKAIVYQCRGHPKSILVVGRMLYFKDPETEWSLLLVELKDLVGEDDIFALYTLCYNQLPSHLKHCFAFCSLFPEGYEMDVQTLIKFWIAQGFIECSDSQCMEDIGYEYFLHLLWRFFFQIVKKDELGKITKCKIDGLMHYIAGVAAGNECKMLRANEADASQVFSRHVSFNFPLDSSWPEIPSSLPQAKGIRTILLCNQSLEEFQERSSSKSICDKIVSCFKFLRMLDLHNSGLKEVPSSIGKLKHLRYLDLSENMDIIELPASITMLQSLQTLKLSSCYGLKELPKEISKLVDLRHLEFDWCYSLTRMPHGWGKLTNLQTLSEVELTKGTDELSELKELNNLRGALKISKLRSGIQSESANLGAKQHLSSLTLTWDFISKAGDATDCVEKTLEGLKPPQNLRELALVGYEGVNFSSWLSSLTSLVKLSLRRSKCQHIPPLSELRSLKILILDETTSLKYISDSLSNESSPLLPSLEELRLSELPNLRGWWRDDSHVEDDNSSAKNIKTSASSSSSPSMVGIHHMFPSFPRLSKLIIEDCPKLNFMPLYPNLKEWLVLDNTSWKPFQLTLTSNNAKSPLMEDESSSSSSSASPALSELSTLCIVGIEELDKSKADEIDWKALKSLGFLRLDYLPKLEVLPDGLQYVISLKELHIWRCNIETIPERISKLISLRRLSILVCPYLTSLPAGIRRLTSLETLEIVDCPILLQRCQREIGADWDKIAHIPNLLFPQLQSFSLISSLKNCKSLSKQQKNLSSTTGTHS